VQASSADDHDAMTIEERLRDFIADEISGDVDSDQLTDDYPLRDIVDSLGLFEVVSFVESEFGVEIDNEELVPTNFDTIGRIADLVKAKQ
jgi:acyl carrier protein